MVLKNCGFRNVRISYPYWGSAYAHPVADHLKFAAKLLFRTKHRFPFWRNIMYVLAESDRRRERAAEQERHRLAPAARRLRIAF
jgi:hypothetical protein